MPQAVFLVSPKTENGKTHARYVCESTTDFISKKDLSSVVLGMYLGLNSPVFQTLIADLIRDYDILRTSTKDASVMPRKIQQEKSRRTKRMKAFIEQTTKEING